MVFDPEDYQDEPPPPEKKASKPQLRIVK